MDKRNIGFGTKAIHGGGGRDISYGSLAQPIYQTSTFVFDNTKQGGNRFAGEEEGFIYSRLGNPTTNSLERKLAVLEGADASVVFSSGMGAISSTFWSFVKMGDHIVADTCLYGCTYVLLSEGLKDFGVEVSFVNTSNLDEVKDALREETVMVYLETPANPTLKITDIEKLSKLSHDYNKDIKVVVDNTFATPYNTRPLELGADIVIHSLTKYLNGHGDVIAGCAMGSNEDMAHLKGIGLKDLTGAVLSPIDSYLIIRGLKTLEIRMERHAENAEKVVEFLLKHPKVKIVYYPGLESHEGHEIAKKQMKTYGGMIAFEVEGKRENAAKVLDNVSLCRLAVSLGDPESLIEHPASMTHATYSEEELKEAGIPSALIRLSVGLENPEDIINDLENALSFL